MTNSRQNIISRIVRELFSDKLPKDMEIRAERFFIDEQYEQEKTRALNDEWDSMKVERAAGAKERELLGKTRNRLGMEVLGRKLGLGRVVLRVAAVVIPVMLIAGGWLYFNRDSVQEVRMVEFAAGFGKREMATLPDGSRVWVNSGSTLKYPENMAQATRATYIVGEGYYDVAKDASKPFTVEAEHIKVTVLGTEFNVEAYPDRSLTIVTLYEGKVRLDERDGGNRNWELKPNQRFVYNNQSREWKIIDLDEIESLNSNWRSGQLVCNQMSMREMMKAIERKYDIKIDIDGSVEFKDRTYSVVFLSTDTPEDIMNLLKDMDGGFDYRIEQGTIKVLR